MSTVQDSTRDEPAPTVTVVIATYKAGDYLRQAIDSALTQSLGDLELIVSDDAGDPEVRRMTESFGDPRISYRGNPRRLGPAGNHWSQFAAARGRYISILNHDDLWRKGFLATMVSILDRNPEVSLAFCDHEVIDSEGRVLGAESRRLSGIWGRDRLERGRHQPFTGLVAHQTIPLAMGGVFRRDALDLASLRDVGPAYDLWVAYQLSRGGSAAWYVDERLTAWRVHPTQLTEQGEITWTSGCVECWSEMVEDPNFAPYKAILQKKLGLCARAAARTLLTEGDRRAARTYARLAMGHCPRCRQSRFLFLLSFLKPEIARRSIRLARLLRSLDPTRRRAR